MAILIVLFVFAWLIARTLAEPSWKKGTLHGAVTMLAVSGTLFFVIIHPLVYPTLSQSDPDGASIRNKSYYSVLFVLAPLMLGSLFEPRPSKEFFTPWRLFCYFYTAVTAAHILVLQYLWFDVRFTSRHELFVAWEGLLEILPWLFCLVAVACAFSVQWVIRQCRH